MNDPLKAILILVGIWIILALSFAYIIPLENSAEPDCFPNYIGSCD